MSGTYVASESTELSVKTILDEMADLNDSEHMTAGFTVSTGSRTYDDGSGGTYSAVNIGNSSFGGSFTNGEQNYSMHFAIPAGKEFIFAFVGDGNGHVNVTVSSILVNGQSKTLPISNFNMNNTTERYLYKNGNSLGQTSSLSTATYSDSCWMTGAGDTVTITLSVNSRPVDTTKRLDIIFRN